MKKNKLTDLKSNKRSKHQILILGSANPDKNTFYDDLKNDHIFSVILGEFLELQKKKYRFQKHIMDSVIKQNKLNCNQMRKKNSTKKKYKKTLLSPYHKQQQKKHQQFVQSYPQLLNKHFSQSMKEKSSLRRTLSASQGFNNKITGKLFKPNQYSKKKFILLQEEPKLFKQDSNADSKKKSSLEQMTRSINQSKILVQSSFAPEMRNSHQQKQLTLNPQTNQRIQKIILSKTQLLQKNSLQNVLLSQKLYQSAYEKKQLMNYMQNLRMQILKQNKIKAKISVNIGKLMNKIEQVNNFTKKTQQERFYINQEIKILQKQYNLQQIKKHQLESMSQRNKEKTNIEKELLNSLEKKIENTKMQFFQTRNHLNQIKQIYARQSKCLLKLDMNYKQVTEERNLLCQSVEQSAFKIKDQSKQ